MYAGTVLAESLKAAGITLSGQVKRDRTMRAAYFKAQQAGDQSWALLAVHETPLASVIYRANKDSMNLYAECLCKRLGFATMWRRDPGRPAPPPSAEFLSSLKSPHPIHPG